MMVVTSLAEVGPHRCPLPSTTRTVFAPKDLMFANELFWLVNQAYGWLTPRMTNVFPFDSTTRVPLTRSPTGAADAACERNNTDAISVSTVARHSRLATGLLVTFG